MEPGGHIRLFILRGVRVADCFGFSAVLLLAVLYNNMHALIRELCAALGAKNSQAIRYTGITRFVYIPAAGRVTQSDNLRHKNRVKEYCKTQPQARRRAG